MTVRSLVLCALVACTSSRQPIPPKRPNTELIVGEFERRPPTGKQAVRFDSDGTFRFAKNKSELDRSPHLADGTFQLDGDQLTLTAQTGQCTETESARQGIYKIVLSKVGIRFTKVSDACAERSKLDGQTWWRVQ